jgi:hypothetical protein
MEASDQLIHFLYAGVQHLCIHEHTLFR